jgi:WD40 repeat protein/tetratricopeptide (TPR) repeat protein
MSRIFLSHSSKDNGVAVALKDWLADHGWDDVFLDLDPLRGIAAGQRWERELNQAALRCEAVLFLVSRAWLDSHWCLKEFNLAHRLNKRLFGLLIEDLPIGELPASLTATWQLVSLATGRDHVMLRAELPGTHDEVHVTFSEEGLNRLRLGLERAGLDARFFAWPPADDPHRSPYRGLLPMEALDAGVFFGREAPTVEALDRIRGIRDGAAPRLLVLLGASGAGKSSFLRAGLFPRLARDDRNYLSLPVIRPERAAIYGESGLLRSIESALADQGAPQPRAEIRAAIEGGAAELRPLLRTIIAHSQRSLTAGDRDAKAPTLVLSVDQGEELFLAEGASESGNFLALLRDLMADDDPAVLVLVTIRSDSYEQLQTAKVLEAITQQTLSLTPMPRGAYQAVIEGPANRLKETRRPLAIEPRLTEALLFDIDEGGGRDALPLLAFTLERLYLEYGARGRLTLQDYNALGRIRGSIEAAIERAFRKADNDSQIPRDRNARLALLRRGLIPWMAGIDPDTGSPSRQKARQSEIPEEARSLINLLVEERLLSTDINQETGERTIEPAHEALLRQWGLLEGWLQEDFAALANLETIKRAARDWAANGNREDWLAHRSGRLEDAERLLLRQDLAGKLDWTDREYLQGCKEREDRDRAERAAAFQRRSRLQRALTVASIVVAALMASVGLYAYRQKTAAEAATALASANLEIATKAAQEAASRAREVAITSSHYQAEQANKVLSSGDAVTAALLSLDGLPDVHAGEEFQRTRPYVSEAERALYAAWQGSKERLVLSGHSDSIASLAFSPDGRRIITASKDNTARLWDTETGKPLATLSGHIGAVNGAAISPDGRSAATASDDGTARLWDTETGSSVGTLVGHIDAVNNVAFSPDGRRVVTSSKDGTARLWDAQNGAPLTVLVGHEAAVSHASFSPDGRQVITSSGDGTARLWDVETGNPIGRPLANSNAFISGAAFNSDGERVVTWSNRNAQVWNQSGKPVGQPMDGHTGAILDGKFSRDGKRVVTTSDDKTARIWDAETGKPLVTLSGHTEAVIAAVFSSDGTRVLTASRDKTARVWDAATGKTLYVLAGHTDAVNDAAFSPDGLGIATVSSDDTLRLWNVDGNEKRIAIPGRVSRTALSPNGRRVVTSAGLFDLETGKAVATFKAGRQETFSPDGRRLVTLSEGGVSLWNAETGELVAVLGPTARRAAFSPDSHRLVTTSDDKKAQSWDAETGKQIAVFVGDNYVDFSPDSRHVVTTSSGDGTARIWDVDTGKLLVALSGQGGIQNPIFSPDGQSIFASIGDEAARLWDVQTGQTLSSFTVPSANDWVDQSVFSSDGRRILTIPLANDAARLWDSKTGRLVATLKHSALVYSAAFSPDGRRVVTTSNDRTARLWDVETGAALTVLVGHAGAVHYAEFSADSRRVVTVSADGTARIWTVETGEPLIVFDTRKDGYTAKFTLDGRRILTTASDPDETILWEIFPTTQGLVDHVKAALPRCLTPEQREEFHLKSESSGWCENERRWPHDASSLTIQGDKLRNSGNPDAALKYYDDAIHLAETSDQDRWILGSALLGRAQARALSGDQTQAAADLGEASRLGQDVGLAFLKNGLREFDAHKYEDAQSLFDQAIGWANQQKRTQNTLALAFFDRGKAKYFKNQNKEAADDFREATKFGQLEAEGWRWSTTNRLADEQTNNGQLVEALVSSLSNFLELPRLRGSVNKATGFKELGLGVSSIYRPIGRLYAELAAGDAGRATQCDRLASHPDDPLRLATATMSNKIDLPSALAACNEAVAQEPGQGRLYYERGRTHWQIADDAKKSGNNALFAEHSAASVSDIKMAMSLGYPMAYNNMAIYYYNGEGVKQNFKSSAAYYIETLNRIVACCSARVAQQLLLAKDQFDQTEVYRVVRELLSLARDLGDPRSAEMLATLYDTGAIKPADPNAESQVATYENFEIAAMLFQSLGSSQDARRMDMRIEGLKEKLTKPQLDAASTNVEKWRKLPFTLPPSWMRESPLSIEDYVRRGGQLLDEGRDQDAEGLFQQAAKIDPAASTYVSIGDMLRSEGKYAKCADAYGKSIDLINEPKQENWVIFFHRGICLDKAGDWNAAEASLKKALTIFPDEPIALNYLGYSWIEKNQNVDEAMRMIKRAVEQRPDNGEVVDSLGWAYFHIGKYDEAVRQLERAKALKPDDPTINDHLGDAYWRTKRPVDAQAEWKRAIDLGTEPLELKQLESKLASGLAD